MIKILPDPAAVGTWLPTMVRGRISDTATLRAGISSASSSASGPGSSAISAEDEVSKYSFKRRFAKISQSQRRSYY